MEILEKMFGGSGRVKIMRLFLFNPAKAFDRLEVAKRAQVSQKMAGLELLHLERTGLVKRRPFIKDEWVTRGSGKNEKTLLTKKKIAGWQLDSSFPYLQPLENLLINLTTLNHDYLVTKLKNIGKVKLVILSGIFIQEPTSRVDIFLVGDQLKKATLESTMKQLEAEIGKELRYASFETADFSYRMSIYDKLVRDILDYPHKIVLNKLGI